MRDDASKTSRSLRLLTAIAFAAVPAALVIACVAYAWLDYQSSLARLTAPGSTICADAACIAEISGEYRLDFQIIALFGSLAIVMAYLAVLGLVTLAIGMREISRKASYSP